MKISEIMTTGVCSVKINATLLDALKLMIGHRISGLPVVDASGKLVGMVTEGDLMRRSETGTENTGRTGSNSSPAAASWRMNMSRHMVAGSKNS